MAESNALPLVLLAEQFAKLPGIGMKSAQRLAYYVMSMTDRTLWLVSKVLANAAKMNAFVGISDSRCKSRCVLSVPIQDVTTQRSA